MSLREMCPQLKLPINETKCHCNVLTVFLLINEISIAIQFFVYKHGQKCIVKILSIYNLRYKVLMVDSGSKHANLMGR